LSRFDFALKQVADKSMKQVDSLNRRVDWAEEVEKDNKNQIMLKKEWLEIRIMKKRHLLIERTEEEIIEKIKRSEVKYCGNHLSQRQMITQAVNLLR